MAIRRPDPIRALADLQERVNRLFDEVRTITGGADEATSTGTWQPAVDLVDQDGSYTLWADVPGVDPSDVHIEVHESTLTLRGERRPSHQGRSSESFLRSERPVGPFSVSLSLPPSVDVRQIRAVQRAGVLEVSLPKREAVRRDAIRVEVDRDGA